MGDGRIITLDTLLNGVDWIKLERIELDRATNR